MRIKQKRFSLFLILILFLGINDSLFAQNTQITGKVTDDQGVSIPGVSVSVKGSSSGAVTDLDGKFNISVAPKSTLIFRFLGFVTQELAVGDKQVINLSMTASETSLDEVTVIAYGQQKKISITGAISSINNEELMKSPLANVANSIAGKVTGLSTIQSSGQPGADNPEIFVRGVASLSTAQSQPLMIVDGVERSFMSLDPNEIESISILKDASATAVYGVRGANGVIIVTTRRGKIGKPKISTSFSTGLQQPTRLLDFADSYTYALRYNEAQLNDNPNINPNTLKFSPEAIEAFRTGSNPTLYSNTDWLGYLLKPSATQLQGNINVSGGTEKLKYFASLGVLNQDGLFKTYDSQYDYNFSFKRYNYRSNIDLQVTKTTKLGLTIGGQVGIRNQPNTRDGFNQLFRNIYWSVPFSGPGLVDGKYIVSGERYIEGPKKDGLQEFYGQGYTNILNNSLNVDIDLEQKLNFIKGLTFRTKFAYNTDYVHRKIRNSSVNTYEPIYLRDLDPTADQTSDEIVYRRNGVAGNLSYGEGYDTGRNWYFEGGLSYDNSFAKHHVGGLLLYNEQKLYYPKQFTDIPMGLVGLVGRVTYDFDNTYLADFNIGYNGSENFAKNKRFGIFPAVSAGWVVTNESFMKSQSFMDFMKLRVSYGIVGNDRLGGNNRLAGDRFLYLPNSFNPEDGNYSFGTDNPKNVQAASEGQIGNPNVTWETAKKQNYGVDMEFFKSKLGVTFDYFIENRSDILTYRGTVPGFVAYQLPAVNIGVVQNKGFEVELKWSQSVNDDFRYRISANMSHTKNRIVFKDEVPQSEPYLYRTGKPVGQPFGYIFDKFYNDADADNASLPDHQYNLKPGDMVYKDLNGDDVIDQNDQQAIGYPTYPSYNAGINLGFDYKNFDFSMSWAGASNTSRLLAETYRLAFGATLDRSLLQYMADGRWTPETAATATFPRMTLAGSVNNGKDSDFWLRDASYLRLKNVELGYNFKGVFLKKMGISNLRTYLNGANLLTISKLDITDPESRTADDSVYPLTKIYNVGIRVSFL
ncbi:SusC/RagA family TonB-linked outer membrane protein [Pedobacter arcticus]|uniref:SusC/RagA family TonB-linked outer membrane protein n=1 Tax=Pedobacter arcticus TaxID=752140 RepID=UPI00047446F1|nr:TonB-dependent receptor [Pedobacter arcticus]